MEENNLQNPESMDEKNVQMELKNENKEVVNTISEEEKQDVELIEIPSDSQQTEPIVLKEENTITDVKNTMVTDISEQDKITESPDSEEKKPARKPRVKKSTITETPDENALQQTNVTEPISDSENIESAEIVKEKPARKPRIKKIATEQTEPNTELLAETLPDLNTDIDQLPAIDEKIIPIEAPVKRKLIKKIKTEEKTWWGKIIWEKARKHRW